LDTDHRAGCRAALDRERVEGARLHRPGDRHVDPGRQREGGAGDGIQSMRRSAEGGAREEALSVRASPLQAGLGGAVPAGRPTVRAWLIALVDRHQPILFPLPALCLVAALTLYPLVYTLLLSTRSYDLGIRSYSLVGLGHYATALGSGRFWDA